MSCEKCGQEHNVQFWVIANVLLNGKTEIDTAWGKKRVCGLTAMMETTAKLTVESLKETTEVPVASKTSTATAAVQGALQNIVDHWRANDPANFNGILCTHAICALEKAKRDASIEAKEQESMEVCGRKILP